ncbi:hypothetical protein QO239_08390 [Cupriavidus taiwanensis]|uniref:hypothetical protein n=1 Tax=Cupriavidus taiwanensis TaxID=164546 RepID=UPI0025409216|nr:hypothetical protein [Cupriavidus taiwanensis]MDK3022624.1 hypothetical protein [Cupriavidus taiwanensis]
MKRAIAILLLAGASGIAQAQWQGQARMVETYTWGAPETPKPQKAKRAPPAYASPAPPPVYAPPAVPQGAINVHTGQYYPPVAGGVIDPTNGTFHQAVGGGYINTQTGTFSPAH